MTTRIVGQIFLAGGATPSDPESVAQVLCASHESIEGAVSSHAGVHGASSMGGGDLSWDLSLEGDRAVERFCNRVREVGEGDVFSALGGALAELSSQIARVELAIPELIAGHVGVPGLVGIKRTLWLRVLPGTEEAAVGRFEAETPLLAQAVPAIRNWQWSRVRTASPNPMETGWTHLWEQEFETLAGLESDYMASPCHWGYIDRWFDPEMPEQIVDVGLAHLSCPATAPILS
jgi:hypothetical protein